jgi:penicillin V acylase-like amidase (Ntn superfamily)
MKKVLIIVLSFCSLSFHIIYGCSTFLLKGENYCVVGFNENWKTMPGIVVINKRNIYKESLSWKSLTSLEKVNEKTISWKSKYGSVSFNLLGIDLPCYGVNEKGLFIVELYLDKTFSEPDSTKASMFWAQWIQYQLDNYATVEEVIENLNNSPVIDWWPTFPGSHFFLADRDGYTAAIELIDGKYQVSFNENMPVQVLCNEPYQKELNETMKYDFMNGNKSFNIHSQKWEDRFARATYLINKYDSNISPVEYSWQVLDSIHPGQWQLVADLKNNIVCFRSDIGKDIKYLDLSECNFTPDTPVYFIDINSISKGNVINELSELSLDINDDYVEKGFPIGYVNDDFPYSREFDNIKINLRKYMSNLTEQQK